MFWMCLKQELEINDSLHFTIVENNDEGAAIHPFGDVVVGLCDVVGFPFGK